MAELDNINYHNQECLSKAFVILIKLRIMPIFHYPELKILINNIAALKYIDLRSEN